MSYIYSVIFGLMYLIWLFFFTPIFPLSSIAVVVVAIL